MQWLRVSFDMAVPDEFDKTLVAEAIGAKIREPEWAPCEVQFLANLVVEATG